MQAPILWRGAVLSLWCCSCSLASSGPALDFPEGSIAEGDLPRLLHMLADQNKKTWDALDTWRGTIRIEAAGFYWGKRAAERLALIAPDLQSPPAEFESRRIGRAEFAVDLRGDRLFCDVDSGSEGLEWLALPSREPFELGSMVGTPHQISIVSADEYIHIQRDMKYPPPPELPDGGTKATAFRSPVEEAQRMRASVVVDPRDLFGHYRPTWRELELMLEGIERFGVVDVDLGYRLHAIARDNDGVREYEVVFSGRLGSGETRFVKLVFREDVGFLVTSRRDVDQDGAPHREVECEYRRVDGLLMPSRMVVTTLDPRVRRPQSRRTLSLVECEVNPSLPERTFTYQNLGLSDGDRFIDNLTGEIRRFEGGKLKPVILTGPSIDRSQRTSPDGSATPSATRAE